MSVMGDVTRTIAPRTYTDACFRLNDKSCSRMLVQNVPAGSEDSVSPVSFHFGNLPVFLLQHLWVPKVAHCAERKVVGFAMRPQENYVNLFTHNAGRVSQSRQFAARIQHADAARQDGLRNLFGTGFLLIGVHITASTEQIVSPISG